MTTRPDLIYNFLLAFLSFVSCTQAFSFSQHHLGSIRRSSPLFLKIPTATTGVDLPSAADAASDLQFRSRAKVNEIDFCIAPADVSISRAYGTLTPATTSTLDTTTATTTTDTPTLLSLTRSLNNASNRAVRRILLARSWPSAEALNLSLRRVAQAEKEREQLLLLGTANNPKCPVPRPILNVLTRKRAISGPSVSVGRGRTNEEYVADQLTIFRENYGDLPGYSFAEAYLESILSLATSGVESARVSQVIQAGVYDEAYRRVLGVLKRVGVSFEKGISGGNQISSKLADQDICLSVLDKIAIRKERNIQNEVRHIVPTEDAKDGDKKSNPEGLKRFRLFGRKKMDDDDEELTNEDLGGVLLSANEPTMTRQLNVLSNIVWRALLFGGDQELLVLAETLDADRAAFVERWYPNDGTLPNHRFLEEETRPGVQYLNCLVRLLRTCYDEGVITHLEPLLPLSQSFANSYERLVASAVELGSGYLKPSSGNALRTYPMPRNAKEGLGTLALWESNFRQSQPADINPYPEDLEGVWEVRDEIADETIGRTRVVFEKEGKVVLKPPLEGLRWRLDPGPTHLDTCTFQVLSSDGTILQYRGFIDRGARLESRFSKRPIRIRGSVEFQMRDSSSPGYYKDILPINYKAGTTKFVMTKQANVDL
jgi:hypothetical protein